MAELPPELILAILSHITDYISLISLALTSRLYYTTTLPVIIAEEARYVRHVMIPGKHLSIYEWLDPQSRLPPAGLDSSAGLFTGTIRMIDFTPWQDFKYLCCIRRLVRRAKHLEHITMDVQEGSDRSWLTAYISICVGRPGVWFTLNGGDDKLSITDVGESARPKSMRGLKSPFVYQPYFDATPPVSGLHTKGNNISRLYQQLKSTSTLQRPQAGSQRDTNLREPAAPQLSGLKLINENLFSSPLARTVHMLAGSEHITSFTLANARDYNSNIYMNAFSPSNDRTTTSPMAIFASLKFPSLTRLSIAHILLPTSALLNFLVRHPSITDLYLDLLHPTLFYRQLSVKSLLVDWPVPTSPPKQFMPKLVRLGGNAHWVLPFVRWQQQKDRTGGDTGCLPALEQLELRTGTQSGKPIQPTTQVTPVQLDWEVKDLDALYDALFYTNGPSSTTSTLPWKASSSKYPSPEARTCIRSLTLETFSFSHIIDWLILLAIKQQAWPVLRDAAGLGIETLTISERHTFLIPLNTRADLLHALDKWCPEIAKDVELDRQARGAGGGFPYAGLHAPWPEINPDVDDAVEEAFTQNLLARVIWRTFPGLQTLQIGVDGRGDPPARRINRPAGL